jgi:hypothetical protein
VYKTAIFQRYTNFNQVRIKLYSLSVYAQDQWKASSKLAFTVLSV